MELTRATPHPKKSGGVRAQRWETSQVPSEKGSRGGGRGKDAFVQGWKQGGATERQHREVLEPSPGRTQIPAPCPTQDAGSRCLGWEPRNARFDKLPRGPSYTFSKTPMRWDLTRVRIPPPSLNCVTLSDVLNFSKPQTSRRQGLRPIYFSSSQLR